MSLGKDQDTTDATRPHSDAQTARIAELEREVRRLRRAIEVLVEEERPRLLYKVVDIEDAEE